MRFRTCVFVAILTCCAKFAAAADDALLVRSPTLNRTHIVFVYGGYLWSVPRAGGDARQLTTGGHEGRPIFSPDGNWVAFTGEYDGPVFRFSVARLPFNAFGLARSASNGRGLIAPVEV